MVRTEFSESMTRGSRSASMPLWSVGAGSSSPTAEARLAGYPGGARDAHAHVRQSAREAMAAMEAMLDQLRVAPLGKAGLVEAIRKQCEALAFRTGANVEVQVGELPDDDVLAPGVHQAIFRIVQEALANVGRHARARHVRVSLAAAGAPRGQDTGRWTGIRPRGGARRDGDSQHARLGYVRKDAEPEILLAAVRRVAGGQPYIDPGVGRQLVRAGAASNDLTAREIDVLRQLALGRSNKEIAASLAIGEETVKRTSLTCWGSSRSTTARTASSPGAQARPRHAGRTGVALSRRRIRVSAARSRG